MIECPICYETYNEKNNNIPTTFPCGHTCCISHVKNLHDCFACRSKIPKEEDCLPTFSLLDAAFIAMNHQIEMDEKIARLLQQQENLEEQYNEQRNEPMDEPMNAQSIELMNKHMKLNEKTISSTFNNPTNPISSSTSQPTPQQTSQHTSQPTSPLVNLMLKQCSHLCEFSIFKECCACNDHRPILPNDTYPIYVPGQGCKKIGSRKAGYFPTCRT